MAVVRPAEINGSQWCATCAEGDASRLRTDGCWVEIRGHEHELSAPRAQVYLYEPAHDGQGPIWAAFLPICLYEISDAMDSYWLGWREFPTLPEAMEYARRIAIAEHTRREARRAGGAQ